MDNIITQNKKILCKIVDVQLNLLNYDHNTFANIDMPTVGDNVLVEREFWYPFKVGSLDNESILPRIALKNKQGLASKEWLYTIYLQQMEEIVGIHHLKQ